MEAPDVESSVSGYSDQEFPRVSPLSTLLSFPLRENYAQSPDPDVICENNNALAGTVIGIY